MRIMSITPNVQNNQTNQNPSFGKSKALVITDALKEYHSALADTFEKSEQIAELAKKHNITIGCNATSLDDKFGTSIIVAIKKFFGKDERYIHKDQANEARVVEEIKDSLGIKD